MTDSELRALDRDDVDTEAIYNHFATLGRWGWPSIANEAKRVHTVIFGEADERGALVDAITAAALSQAESMAYAAMACALGVDPSDLQFTMEHWSENQDHPPASVTPTRLLEMVEETHRARKVARDRTHH